MKSTFFSLFFLAIVALAKAQSATETFTLLLPGQKVTGSLYQSIRLVDVRPNPHNLGLVQLGAFNRKAKVITETPLDEQVSTLMAALIDSTAQQGELFLLLRQLSFAEVTGAMSEKGYCHFRAVLFARKGEGFQMLDRLDTVFVVKGMDVTRSLLRQGSKAVTSLLAANLSKAPEAGSPVYTSSDVVQFESLEKQSIPLYAATTYKSGIYKTYASFAAQTPDDETMTVDFAKDGSPSAVKRLNEKGKTERVWAKDMYAFVYAGQPYIATEYGYYPLTKNADDFYFTGKARVTASTGDVVLASVFFGVIGGLIASANGNAVFEMKLDYMGGGFVRVKEIKEATGKDSAP